MIGRLVSKVELLPFSSIKETTKVNFSPMAMPLVKILLLVFICQNKIQSYTEKIKYPQYISLRQVFKGFQQRNFSSEQGLRLCF